MLSFIRQYWTAGKARVPNEAAWITDIEIRCLLDEGRLALRYAFGGKSTKDGIGIDVRALPLRLVSLRAIGGKAEVGRLPRDKPDEPAFIYVQPEAGAAWQDVSVDVSFAWAGSQGARAAVRAVALPDQARTPPPLDGNAERPRPLPRVHVREAGVSTLYGIAENGVAGSWLQMALLKDDAQTWAAEGAIGFAASLHSVFTAGELERAGKIGVEGLAYLDHLLGPSRGTRFLCAHPADFGGRGPDDSPVFGAVNIALALAPQLVRQGDLPMLAAWVVLLAGAWWLGGCKLVGAHAKELSAGMCRAYGYDCLRKSSGERGAGARSAGTPSSARIHAIARSIVSAFSRDDLRSFSRRFLADHWGSAVDARVLIDDLAAAGVVLPWR